MPRLLIVDDDNDMREWLATVLKAKGYGVSEASRSDDVVRQLLTGDIDLALIDYHLPDRNGLSLLRDIRDKNMTMPVVMLTADSAQGVAVECFRNGAADFIAKPIDADYLSIVVARTLDNHAGTLKNMAYRALGYVQHKKTCAHFDDPLACTCGLKDLIENIQDF